MFDIDAPHDPKLSELRQIVDDLIECRAQVARLEALQVQHLARAAQVALLMADEREGVPSQTLEPPHGNAPVAADQSTENFENFENLQARVTNLDQHDLALQQVQAEIGTALRVSDRTVARWMDDAHMLTTEYASLMQAFSRGEISRAHATSIADAGVIITNAEARGAYEQEMLDYAKTSSVNRVRQVARQVAEQHSAQTADERVREALKGRCVKIHPLSDGLSQITAVVPSVQGAAMYDRLTRMAKEVLLLNRRAKRSRETQTAAPKNDAQASQLTHGDSSEPLATMNQEALELAATDTRTLMEIRTDLLLDIALTGLPSAFTCETSLPSAPCEHDVSSQAPRDFAEEPTTNIDTVGGTGGGSITQEMLKNIRAHVQIVIPVLSLLPREHLVKLRNIAGFEHLERLSALNGTPHLTGHGPIPSEIARLLLGTASSWDRLLTDPIKGTVVAVDQYQPTASLKRLLVARDQHCRFPGCRVPTKQCEIDHTLDWALGGRTSYENLAHLCLRHHIMKHHTDWKVQQLPGGVLEWTSPLKRTSQDAPVSSVVFKAIDTPSKASLQAPF